MSATPTAAELEALLVDWITRTGVTGGDAVDVDARLDELGLSSRDAVALAGELEDVLDRTVSPTIAWEAPTVRLLAAALAVEPAATGDHAAVGEPASPHEPAAAAVITTGVDPAAPPVADDAVAIVGIGCRYPGGVLGPDDFWALLSEGRDAIGEVPDGRWEAAGMPDVRMVTRHGGFLDDVAGFDAEHFGITPREAELIDPQQRILLEVAHEAVQHARLDPRQLRGSDTGVYVGISASEYGHLTASRLEDVEPWTATGAALSIAANRISYAFDLRGPSLAVDTACSSSLVALHTAVGALRRGETSRAIVGGVNLLLTPLVTASFERAGALAEDGRCKSFGADADGIGRAEGCGVIVVERLSDALAAGRRVLAVIAGSAVNSDGRSNGLTAPNPAAQDAVLRRAWADAGIEPRRADYVEAHGTGTPLGDPIEAGALGRVFGAGRAGGEPLLLGSVKSNLGHLEAAAGLAGVIKVTLALSRGLLPATLHAQRPNPHLDLAAAGLRLVDTTRDWPAHEAPLRAGVSAFGFGGTNAHVVLTQAPPSVVGDGIDAGPGSGAPETDVAVLAVSGRTAARARASATALAGWLADGAGRDATLPAIAAGLAARPADRFRLCVAAVDHGRAIEALQAVAEDDGTPLLPVAPHGDRPVWVFAGYGQQWPGMGRALLAGEPVFAAAVHEAALALAGYDDFDVLSLLRDGREPANVAETMIAIFTVQIGLAALWRSHGVEPAAVIGHSLGEVAAAVVAGGLELADAAAVVAARAVLLSGVEGDAAGAMALVELTDDEVAELVARPGMCPDVEIAVHASPRQCTVAGPIEQVERLVAHVEGLGRDAWPLPVRGAGHSAAVDPVLPELARRLDGVVGRRADIPVYSTVLDDPRAEVVFDAAHWIANARRGVRFRQAVAAAVADGFDTFVEISAHPVVARNLRAVAGDTPVELVGSLRRDTEDGHEFAVNVGRLHAAGHPGVLAARHPGGIAIDLPAQTWLHTPYWFAVTPSIPAPPLGAEEPAAVTMPGRPVPLAGGHTLVWTYPDRAALTALVGTADGPLTLADLTGLAEAAARHLPAGTDAPARAVAAQLDAPLGIGPLLVSCARVGAGAIAEDGRVEVEVFHDAGGWVRSGRVELTVPAAARPVSPAALVAVGDPDVVPHDLPGITEWLVSRLGAIMGIAAVDLDVAAPLTSLGFDSLMATRARNAVESTFAVPLPVRLLLQGLTLSGLAEHLTRALSASDAATPPTPPMPPSPASPARRPAPGRPVRHVEARDPAERLMAGLWTDALGETVGVTADLSTRPGALNAAQQVVDALWNRFGSACTSAELVALRTIERMADLVRDELDSDGVTQSGAAPVRVLHPRGSGRPLFFFHPAGGPTSVYQPLVDRLGGAHPAFGFERLEDCDTVETKATRYLESIRRHQPAGPYRLLGWSLGGLLAVECAQQLRASGDRVELLACFDTILPLEMDTSAAVVVARYRRFARHLGDTYGIEIDVPEGIADLDQAGQLVAMHQAMTSSGLVLPAGVLQHQYTSYVDARIAEGYTPSHWPQHMVLYRAQEVEALTTSLDPRYLRHDRALGWDEFAPEMEIVDVPGNHISMIDTPHVDVLAADLRQRLERLDRRPAETSPHRLADRSVAR